MDNFIEKDETINIFKLNHYGELIYKYRLGNRTVIKKYKFKEKYYITEFYPSLIHPKIYKQL